MAAIIRVLGVARGTTDEWFVPKQYLKSYDLEAHQGRGDCELTTDKAEALRFADAQAALFAWYAVPLTRQVREDGKPNRPLTAFHAEIITVPS